MADWLMELVEQKRRKAIEDENARPAPKDGRTRAELIYGRTRNDEESRWSQPAPPIFREAKLREAASAGGLASVAPPPAAAKPSQSDTTAPPGASAPADAGTGTAATRQLPKKPAFDVDKAVEFLDKHALDKSRGNCANYVVNALVHGGANIPERTRHAKDFGDHLEWAGLEKIDKTNYAPKKGDVAVIQPHTKGESGHMQMWNGTQWESDYRQKRGEFYPNDFYRTRKPSYEIYR